MRTADRLHGLLAESIFPTRWDRLGGARPAVETIGLLGVALMAFTLALGNTGQSIGMGLLIIASLLTWPALWRDLKTDWVGRLVLIWFSLVLLRTVWAVWEIPELSAMHFDRMRSVARILLFPVVCWWLGGERRSVLSICILVLAGAIIGIFYYGDSGNVVLPGGSLRLSFGGDPRMQGLLYVSILAGMIAFARAWWGSYSNKPVYFARVLLWLVLYLVVLWALIAVQARAAWLAGSIVALVFLAWFMYKALRRRAGGSSKLEGAIALIFLLGTGAVLASFASKISNRLLEEHETYALLLRGDVERIEDPSLAGRAYLIDLGWSAWLQRPLFGWGPGIGRYLVSRSDIPLRHRGSSDLHNNYLDLLVQFGVVGALIFFGLWCWLIARSAQWWWAGKIPIDMGAFVISVSLMFFIVNFTDTYIDFQFGWFYMMFLCALLHSPLMRLASADYNKK